MRELKNIVERALIESEGREIQPFHLYFLQQDASRTASDGAGGLPPGLPQDLDQAVAQANGNISEAAQLLNTNRNRIYRILDQEKE